MKIFYELSEKEIYFDIFLNEEDMVFLQEGSLICKNTIVPVKDDDLFNRTVCVGIIAPKALHVYDDIWDEELIEGSIDDAVEEG